MADVPASDLVNSAQVAERLGLTDRQRVITWRHRYDDFPSPVIEQGKVMLWSWTAVREWAVRTGRLPDAAE